MPAGSRHRSDDNLLIKTITCNNRFLWPLGGSRNKMWTLHWHIISSEVHMANLKTHSTFTDALSFDWSHVYGHLKSTLHSPPSPLGNICLFCLYLAVECSSVSTSSSLCLCSVWCWGGSVHWVFRALSHKTAACSFKQLCGSSESEGWLNN